MSNQKLTEKKIQKIEAEMAEEEKTPDKPYRETPVVSRVPKLLSELSPDNYQVEWIWDGYICKSHLTLLSALWKAGKTTLVTQLLKCIQEERSLAGQPVKKAKVLILSEETESLWARRKEDLELEGKEVWVLCKPIRSKLRYWEWVSFLKKTAKFCKENEIDLVIIDTLTDFWGVYNENDASQTNQALKPLAYLTQEAGVAVLLVHHFRKAGGSEGVASRGSGAIASYVDIIIEFRRMDFENPNDTQRVLRGFSRFDETPQEVVIELVNDEYITRGTRQEVTKEAKLMKVLLILSQADKSLTTQEISDHWDQEEFGRRPHKRTIQRYLEGLLYDGRVEEVGTRITGKTKAPTYTVTSPNNARQQNARQVAGQKGRFEPNNARHDRVNPNRMSNKNEEETELDETIKKAEKIFK